MTAVGMVAGRSTVLRVIRDILWEQKGNVKLPKRLGTQNLPSVYVKPDRDDRKQAAHATDLAEITKFKELRVP